MARQVRWSVCARWHGRTRKRGSRRCCITLTLPACGRLTRRSARRPRRGWIGVTWEHYGQDCEANSKTCSAGCTAERTGRSRPQGVHPEAGRAARPLGIAALEDKIVQRAMVEVLNADLRGGLPRLLLRVPAGAQPARRAGRAGGRDREEEGELGARRGHPWFLRCHRPRMAAASSSSTGSRTSGSCGSSRNG